MTPEEISERSIYVELNRNESRIITERQRAMLTFHGFLFAAVGISAGQRLFILALFLAVVGLFSCKPWRSSVLLSYKGCTKVNIEYNNRKPPDMPGIDAYEITDLNMNEFWILPEVFMPVAVAATWLIVLIVLTTYLMGYY